MVTLNDVYLEILRRVAKGNSCEAKEIQFLDVIPTFERIEAIERLSPTNISKKSEAIL
jgi:hypothetical protein